jgi:hypothetical protein
MVSFRLQALREFLTDACDFEEDVLSLDSLNTLNVLKFLSKGKYIGYLFICTFVLIYMQ